MAAESPTHRVHVLVWDHPDMDRRLGEVTGEQQTNVVAPSFEAVYRWLQKRCEPGEIVDAIIFLPVPDGQEGGIAPWVADIRRAGFSVFVKPVPAVEDTMEMSQDLLAMIGEIAANGSIGELLVGSHVGESIIRPILQLVREETRLSILGYREVAGFVSALDNRFEFIDVESIPDAFSRTLPRTNLFDLPVTGTRLGPLTQTTPSPVRSHDAHTPSLLTPPTSTLHSRSLDPPPPVDADVLPSAPSIPEPSIPEPSIPEPSIPEPSIPEPSIPEPSIPEPSIPGTSMPEPPMPDLKLSESSAREPTILEPVIPETSISDLGSLGTQMPDSGPPDQIRNLESLPKPVLSSAALRSQATSIETIFDFVDGLVRHEPNGVELARVGYQLQQRYPDFDGPAVGFARLADLAASVAQERNLALESRNGTPILRNLAIAGADRPGRPLPPNGRATA